MEESRSRQQFAEMMTRPAASLDLAEAALLIACEEYPELDVAGYLAQLDDMGALLRSRLGSPDRPVAEQVAALNQYLFAEQGFHGNPDDYYDPRNSFLNQVLDRRTGIPITLSTVYIEVGRRAGLAVDGVGLPGHFIVRVHGADAGLLVDPYHQGTVLSPADCQARLDRIYGGRLKVSESMLSACASRSMLARMLHNLKAIYLKATDLPRALGSVELLLSLDPDSAEDLRDRGLIYAALDCYTLAARDLQAYLDRSPHAPEAAALRSRIAQIRQQASRLN